MYHSDHDFVYFGGDCGVTKEQGKMFPYSAWMWNHYDAPITASSGAKTVFGIDRMVA